jgi:Zn-dependent M28 family amino/carboxypeptidase
MKRMLLSILLLGAVAAQPAAQTVRPSKMFDAPALLNDLKTLSADDMNGRAVGSADSAKARAYLISRFTAAGLKPIGATFEHPFTFTSGGRNTTPVERQGVNIVGEIKGKKSPATYLVVTAHYDHLAPRNGVIMNGADDNASGAAALVSVAQYFARHQPEHSVIIVACDAEEVGLRGAAAFAAAPPVPAESLIANINLDMIGRDPDDKLFAIGTLLNPFLKPYVAEVARKAPVKLLMGHDDPANKALDDWTSQSDHYAFWTKLKMPFIYLGVEDEAQHHKATDDYETMSHDFYVRAVETTILLIEHFDKHLDAIAKRR